jgi:hypothetical protein
MKTHTSLSSKVQVKLFTDSNMIVKNSIIRLNYQCTTELNKIYIRIVRKMRSFFSFLCKRTYLERIPFRSQFLKWEKEA